ncbi:MAG: EamA family transporter [Eubacterium sp.]|nr:EamA family transporter [Eubacterium sp.]
MAIKIILYALFSATGLVFLKLGTKQNFSIVFDRYACSLQINYMLVLGMFFYIASFLLSLSIMKKANLSIFYSISVGFVYICVCIMSYFILKEKITFIQFIGMGLILAGILVMNING